jgi:hypothetical protein
VTVSLRDRNCATSISRQNPAIAGSVKRERF